MRDRTRPLAAVCVVLGISALLGGRPLLGCALAAMPPEPALWDSAAVLQVRLGAGSTEASAGAETASEAAPVDAVLEDALDAEVYVQADRFWSERTWSRTFAIADPGAWTAEQIGLDLIVPPEAQILEFEVWVRPRGAEGDPGSAQRLANSVLVRRPLRAGGCDPGLERLRLEPPIPDGPALLSWKLRLREPRGTLRTRFAFANEHPTLRSRFTLRFPAGLLDTDWGQHIRTYGPVPAVRLIEEVGRFKGSRVYVYEAQNMAGYPGGPYRPPRWQRMPHLVLLPGGGDLEGEQEAKDLLNRMERAAELDEKARGELLGPIRSSVPAPERARALHDTLQQALTVVGAGNDPVQYRIRVAGETWAARCGHPADAAVLLTASLRELGVPARPHLVRSARLGPVDPSARDPFEHDAILVHLDVDDPPGGIWLDPGCRDCAFGAVSAALYGATALGIDRGALAQLQVGRAGAANHRTRRLAVLRPIGGRTRDEVPSWEGTVTIEATGEPAAAARGADPEQWLARQLADRPAATVLGAVAGGGEPGATPREGTGESGPPVDPEVGLEGRIFRVEGQIRLQPEGTSIAEALFDHAPFLPEPGPAALEEARLPYPFVVADTTIVLVPEGWSVAEVPDPVVVQGAGFRFTTRTTVSSDTLRHASLLAVDETVFPGARAGDLLELARSVAEKDRRRIRLERR